MSALSVIFVWKENSTRSNSAKFINWGDHVNSVPDLAASPPAYSSSSVTTYISAISYVHKLAGVADPTEAPLIIQILKRYRKLTPITDVRLPIILPVLRNLIGAFEHSLYHITSLVSCLPRVLQHFLLFSALGS